MSEWSQTFTFYEGRWIEGNPPILGPRDHAFWLASSVFDGARAFEGVAPDLDRHCARVNHSAKSMWLKPTMTAEAIEQLAWDGIKKFAPGTELYIRPMYWAERNGPGSVPPDPESTKFLLTIYEAALTDLRDRDHPLALSQAAGDHDADRRQGRLPLSQQCAGADGSAYARFRQLPARRHARQCRRTRHRQCFPRARRHRHDARANGSFLNGITRQRVLKLLKADGVEARETTLAFADFDSADEIFVVGNYGKVSPVKRIESRSLQPGPLFRRARQLYWDFAHSQSRRRRSAKRRRSTRSRRC